MGMPLHPEDKWSTKVAKFWKTSLHISHYTIDLGIVCKLFVSSSGLDCCI